MVIDYIISLTNLYGLVHKEKVVEIYNMQHEEKEHITLGEVNAVKMEVLEKGFVYIRGAYFVHEAIIDEIEYEKAQRKGKPFYIPSKDKLLRYRDDFYFERTPQYKKLVKFMAKNFYQGDNGKAEVTAEEIQGTCQFGFSMQAISDVLINNNIDFKEEKQIHEMMNLIMDLANNIRLWENNGHTPHELSELEKRHMLPHEPVKVMDKKVKIGRNDPCLCGSGKKYKKCCALP